MQVIITEPIFLWYLGITSTLIILILILLAIALVYVLKILKLAKDKSITIGKTVDVVQQTVRHTAESVDDVQSRIAQFFNFSMTAKNVSNLVASVRSAWKEPEKTKTADQELEDVFEDIDIEERKDKNG